MRLQPGARLGILGGGQLGRMLAAAAYRLGLRVHVFAETAGEPALAVTARSTCASFADEAALDAFAGGCDVVTLEFENVPTAALERIAATTPVRPGAGVLAVSQDRLAEKRLARALGLETAPFAAVDAAGALAADAREVPFPARLKTRRLGYDGKGQVPVATAAGLAEAVAALGGVPAILEGEVAFARELSILVARSPSGMVETFPLAENRHADGILAETLAPATASAAIEGRAREIAVALADALGLEGLLAVELFETADGRLLVNELAPRPHNSGHWTLDACLPDQFEQAVRAVCDWPLGRARPLARARMINLLGRDVDGWANWLARPGARLHLYGKAEVRAGRKLGHVTVLEPAP
ncbi:MAG: 5-(carboxyamino)imidazole ribonucleotide synthase [Alphaproteobacteria bacterium]